MLANQTRRNWRRHIDQVIRSRHYAWLAESRDGDPIDDVMRDTLADIMHICKRQDIDWPDLLSAARAQFIDEETEA